jgi:NarL family two-component system response regulator LiaR
LSRIKVLLAEDHMITRQGIRRLLEGEGDIDIVGEADDGEQAVKLALEKKPDVIIMDIAMPILNGVEATRQIKSFCPTVAVLILSAYDDDEYVFGLLDMGVAGYLLKTATGDELIRAVEAANKGESVLDNAITSKLISRFRTPGDVAVGVKPYESLSERETQILKLAARGMSNQEIADELIISKRTVEGYMRSIFNKLGVGSRTEAVIYGLKRGWFALDELA